MPDHPRVGIILVVDDQEGVRAILRRELSDRGHTVLEAADGAEAAIGAIRNPPDAQRIGYAAGYSLGVPLRLRAAVPIEMSPASALAISAVGLPAPLKAGRESPPGSERFFRSPPGQEEIAHAPHCFRRKARTWQERVIAWSHFASIS